MTLLPVSDVQERVRELCFAMLLAERRPLDPAEIAAAMGRGDVTAVLDRLAGAGWIDRDPEGRVTGSAGLSLTDGPHRLHLGTTTFRTWCAYDAIGIPAALGLDATVETTCGVCGQPIVVVLASGVPVAPGTELLWLATRSGDLRSQFCAPTVLLCGAAHGESWAMTRHHAGQLLDLKAATVRGAADWASCATAARRVRSSADLAG